MVTLTEECVTTFNDLKLRKTFSYITFKLSNDLRNFVIDKTGSPGASFDEFLETLPSTDYRYGVVTVNYRTLVGDCTKFVFVLWLPDPSKVKQKMIYASNKDTVKRGLDGIQLEVQGTDKTDVELQAIIDRCFAK